MNEKRINEVIVGKHYRHFKGSVYEIVGSCIHSENLSEMVLYQKVLGAGESSGPSRGDGSKVKESVGTKDSFDSKVWARPKEMFFGWKVFEDGRPVRRFEPI